MGSSGWRPWRPSWLTTLRARVRAEVVSCKPAMVATRHTRAPLLSVSISARRNPPYPRSCLDFHLSKPRLLSGSPNVVVVPIGSPLRSHHPLHDLNKTLVVVVRHWGSSSTHSSSHRPTASALSK